MIDGRDARAQPSGDPLRNKRVHVLGTGMVAAAMGIALANTGLIEGLDFVIIDPDEIETTGEGDLSPAATPRVVSISYGPKGGGLTLVTSAGTIAARNIVVANDAIWHNSGLASGLSVRRADKSERAGPAFTGRPVPGLFTVGYPDAATRSEQFTLYAAAGLIAALIEQRR